MKYRAGPGPEPEAAIRRVIEILGLNADEEGLKDTPRRFYRMLYEMTQGYMLDPELILSKRFKAEYDQMVVVKDISFWSLCQHHILPIHGVAHVGYIPKGEVVGLSKIPKLVECFAHRLQIQERLTQQIADSLEEHLKPAGVAVVLRAMHTCMAMRGVRSTGDMVTSAMLGAFREQPEVRAEFLAFLDR